MVSNISVQEQDCCCCAPAAALSGLWKLIVASGWLENLSFLTEIMCWAPSRELGCLQFFLEHNHLLVFNVVCATHDIFFFYSRTPPYCHLGKTVTSLQQPPFYSPVKRACIFLSETLVNVVTSLYGQQPRFKIPFTVESFIISPC